jgi:hypothetical protein
VAMVGGACGRGRRWALGAGDQPVGDGRRARRRGGGAVGPAASGSRLIASSCVRSARWATRVARAFAARVRFCASPAVPWPTTACRGSARSRRPGSPPRGYTGVSRRWRGRCPPSPRRQSPAGAPRAGPEGAARPRRRGTRPSRRPPDPRGPARPRPAAAFATTSGVAARAGAVKRPGSLVLRREAASREGRGLSLRLTSEGSASGPLRCRPSSASSAVPGGGAAR